MLGRLAIGVAAVGGGLVLARRLLDRAGGDGPHRTQSEAEFREATNRIVILGAGFGGISAALELERHLRDPNEASTLVIDRDNSTLFTPLLWPVANGVTNPSTVVVPVRSHQRERAFHFLKARVERIDLDARIVYAEGAEPRPYDYLVIALGSVTAIPDLPGLRERSLTFASPADALTLRNRLIDKIERAHLTADPAERRATLTFVVGGGGDTGVEVAATIHDYLESGFLREYPWLGNEPFRVVVVGRADRLVPTAPAELSAAVTRELERIGVEVQTGAAIEEVGDTWVRTSNGTIPAHTIFWAAGTTAPRVVRELPVKRAKNGAILVDDRLRIPEHPEVYVIGDSSWAYDAFTGEPLPPTAQAAEQQGRYVARGIAAKLENREMGRYSFTPRGHLVLLGRRSGVAQIGPATLAPRPPFVMLGNHPGLKVGPVILTGLPAWVMWHFYYTTHIPSWRNRIRIVADFVLSFLTGRETSQLRLQAGQLE